MPRHNREVRGTDQRGAEYAVSYQPDWLGQVKVTRDLPNGRQSTKTLFRNEDAAQAGAGTRVRTRLSSPAQDLDVEVALDDPRGIVRRVIVETELPDGTSVSFVVDSRARRSNG